MCDTVRTLEEALVEHRRETEMTLVIFFILLSPSLGQFLVKYQVGSGNSGQSYIEKKCTTETCIWSFTAAGSLHLNG